MSQPPIIKRRWTLTALDANNNKFWEFERNSATGATTVVWGRIGTKGQTKSFIYTDYELERRIAEKESKGYKEVQLHAVSSIAVQGVSSMPPAVQKFVDQVFRAANESINTYLATTVDALSVRQINAGRRALTEVGDVMNGRTTFVTKLAAIEAYYKIIPTKLPARLRDDAVQKQMVAEFNLGEQETRLDQLEAALATLTVSGAVPSANYVALGAEIREIPASHPAYLEIAGRIKRSMPGARISGVFAVKIPAERAAYEAEQFGASNVAALYHGTGSANVRHILKSCLRVPRFRGHVANGSRLGYGIYFSDKASRSHQYTGGAYGIPSMMFGVDVKLGSIKVYTGRDETLRQAPTGYHSTQGVLTHSGLGDEFVVYKESQATIRYVVTF